MRIRNALIAFVVLVASLAPKEGAAQLQTDTLLTKASDIAKQLFYRNHDTTYLKSFPDGLAVRLVGVSKSNYLRVRDRNLNSNLRYRPDRRFNLGFGVAYRWFSVALTFNFGIAEQSEFEDSKYFDFQGAIFSSKHYVSAAYQYYLGYKLVGGNIDDAEIPESTFVRNDIRTIHVGLNYLYVFNYGKFSLQAPFSMNEVQRKSAGSVVAGASFALNVTSSDSSMIPPELDAGFNDVLNFTDLAANSLSLDGGYIYTFVYREKYFATLGMIPGLSFVVGDYQLDKRNLMNLHIMPKLQIMGSIGYNWDRYFGAVQINATANFIKLEPQQIMEYGRGKVTLTFGYRFYNQSR